jgi:hypothetical protein
MGYCMSQSDSKFKILKDSFDKIKEAVLAAKERKTRFGFANIEHLNSNSNIEDIFEEFSWEIEKNEQGDVCYIQFTGEKMGNDLEFFNVIASHVVAGSFIEMSGEDGGLWRWVFDGKTCKEISPTIIWE